MDIEHHKQQYLQLCHYQIELGFKRFIQIKPKLVTVFIEYFTE